MASADLERERRRRQQNAKQLPLVVGGETRRERRHGGRARHVSRSAAERRERGGGAAVLGLRLGRDSRDAGGAGWRHWDAVAAALGDESFAVTARHFAKPESVSSARTHQIEESLVLRNFRDGSAVVPQEIATLRKLAGVPRVTPHGLRGTFASLDVEGSDILERTAGRLGHSSSTTTERRYATEDAVAAGRASRVGANLEAALARSQQEKPATKTATDQADPVAGAEFNLSARSRKLLN